MDLKTASEMIVSSEWETPPRPYTPWRETRRPDNHEPTCVRCMINVADYDHESQSYGNTCESCFWTGTSGPRHSHTLKYWPEYVAYHSEREPNVADHRWVTSDKSNAVFSRPGVLCGWYCEHYGCDAVLPIGDHSEAFVRFAVKRLYSRFDQS